MGAVAAIMEDAAYQDLRQFLELDGSSQVLLISTEGDTDRANYRKIVWDGLHPSL